VIWELVFMMIVLKIPIVYLCAVVYWAIRAEPEPDEGAPVRAVPTDPCPWADAARKRRSLRTRPGPPRRPLRPTPRTAFARATVRP
jgi:hypothetical protein